MVFLSWYGESVIEKVEATSFMAKLDACRGPWEIPISRDGFSVHMMELFTSANTIGQMGKTEVVNL